MQVIGGLQVKKLVECKSFVFTHVGNKFYKALSAIKAFCPWGINDDCGI